LLVDAVANIAGMVASASDTILLADVGVGYGGWEPIPNPGQVWTPISPAGGSGWTPIPATSSTWTPIGNS
jgi:hypothetical protein